MGENSVDIFNGEYETADAQSVNWSVYRSKPDGSRRVELVEFSSLYIRLIVISHSLIDSRVCENLLCCSEALWSPSPYSLRSFGIIGKSSL